MPLKRESMYSERFTGSFKLMFYNYNKHMYSHYKPCTHKADKRLVYTPITINILKCFIRTERCFYQNVEISAHKHRLMLKNKWTKPHVRSDLLQILYIPCVQRVPVRIGFSWTKRQAEGSLRWKCKKIYNFHRWWRAIHKNIYKETCSCGNSPDEVKKETSNESRSEECVDCKPGRDVLIWSGSIYFPLVYLYINLF